MHGNFLVADDAVRVTVTGVGWWSWRQWWLPGRLAQVSHINSLSSIHGNRQETAAGSTWDAATLDVAEAAASLAVETSRAKQKHKSHLRLHVVSMPWLPAEANSSYCLAC